MTGIFQSTHPSGVRPLPGGEAGGLADFNPRTPVGCDTQNGTNFANVPISIHAPQWGATLAFAPRLQYADISIHAPQWGATRQGRVELLTAAEFQSTHPSGVRPCAYESKRQSTTFQSTHPSGVRLQEWA